MAGLAVLAASELGKLIWRLGLVALLRVLVNYYLSIFNETTCLIVGGGGHSFESI